MTRDFKLDLLQKQSEPVDKHTVWGVNMNLSPRLSGWLSGCEPDVLQQVNFTLTLLRWALAVFSCSYLIRIERACH